MTSPNYKIIFEGPELSGKSFLMSQIYHFLEPKYSSGEKRILDGCHWFNCDVGIFGTKYGQKALTKYLELVENMADANVMLEKFHLTEAVYQKLYNNKNFNFQELEKRLTKIRAKIVMATFDENEDLLRLRLQDRFNLYPHYESIAQEPKDYIKQQRTYLQFLKKSKLPHLIVNASVLPNEKIVKDILKFIGEK